MLTRGNFSFRARSLSLQVEPESLGPELEERVRSLQIAAALLAVTIEDAFLVLLASRAVE